MGKNLPLAYYNAYSKEIDHVHKKVVSGIHPRNAEQAFSIHALTNPNIKLVTLQGIAGTGKTLLALCFCTGTKKTI